MMQCKIQHCKELPDRSLDQCLMQPTFKFRVLSYSVTHPDWNWHVRNVGYAARLNTGPARDADARVDDVGRRSGGTDRSSVGSGSNPGIGARGPGRGSSERCRDRRCRSCDALPMKRPGGPGWSAFAGDRSAPGLEPPGSGVRGLDSDDRVMISLLRRDGGSGRGSSATRQRQGVRQSAWHSRSRLASASSRIGRDCPEQTPWLGVVRRTRARRPIG